MKLPSYISALVVFCVAPCLTGCSQSEEQSWKNAIANLTLDALKQHEQRFPGGVYHDDAQKQIAARKRMIMRDGVLGLLAPNAEAISKVAALWEEYLRDAPNDAFALNNLGVIRAAQMRFDESEKCLTKAYANAKDAQTRVVYVGVACIERPDPTKPSAREQIVILTVRFPTSVELKEIKNPDPSIEIHHANQPLFVGKGVCVLASESKDDSNTWELGPRIQENIDALGFKK